MEILTAEHSPASSAYGTLSEASKSAENESAPCSPLLLSCSTLPIDHLDYNCQRSEFSAYVEDPRTPQSPSSQTPSNVSPNFYSRAASEAVLPPDTPLLFQPDHSSVLEPRSVHVGYNLESEHTELSGSLSLRATVLALGEQAISASRCHQLERNVKLMIIDGRLEPC